MQKNATFNELAAILADIEHISNSHPALLIFNQAKFKAFLKENGFAIKRLEEMKLKIVNKYTSKDEKGNPLLITDTNGSSQLAFPNELDKKAFTDAWNDFMEKPVTLSI